MIACNARERTPGHNALAGFPSAGLIGAGPAAHGNACGPACIAQGSTGRVAWTAAICHSANYCLTRGVTLSEPIRWLRMPHQSVPLLLLGNAGTRRRYHHA
jgi:hypothetical protein